MTAATAATATEELGGLLGAVGGDAAKLSEMLRVAAGDDDTAGAAANGGATAAVARDAAASLLLALTPTR